MGGARRLILNCDDFGSCLAANAAVEEALEHGLATSATVMIPCPWAYDAVQRARAHPHWAIGVHLTLTSEWARYRWRPLVPRDTAPGLYDPEGFLWRRSEDVHAQAGADDALAECVAQVEQAIAWGLRPTHLDSHMGTLQTHPAFYAVYLDVARRFGLPVRMGGEPELAAAAAAGQTWAGRARAQAAEMGIAFPDDLPMGRGRRPGEPERDHLLRLLQALPPGSTELLLHPAVASAELEAITSSAQRRAADLHLLTRDAEFAASIAGGGIELISYRDL